MLNGFIPIASLNYEKFFSRPFRALYSHLGDRLYSIVAEERDCEYDLYLLSFNAKPVLSSC